LIDFIPNDQLVENNIPTNNSYYENECEFLSFLYQNELIEIEDAN